MLTVLLSLAVQVTQAPATPRPALSVSVRPANPTVVVGDSIRLAGEVRDSQADPYRTRISGGSGAHSRAASIPQAWWKPVPLERSSPTRYRPSTENRPGRRPSAFESLPQPAARVALNHRGVELVVGQRLALDAEVFAANGDRRRDPVTWASTLPAVATVSSSGARHRGCAPGRAMIRATARLRLTWRCRWRSWRTRYARVEITGGAPEARTGNVLRFKAIARDAAGKEIAGLTPSWTMAPGSGTPSTMRACSSPTSPDSTRSRPASARPAAM